MTSVGKIFLLSQPNARRFLSARFYTCAIELPVCADLPPNPALRYQQRMHDGPRPMWLGPLHDDD